MSRGALYLTAWENFVPGINPLTCGKRETLPEGLIYVGIYRTYLGNVHWTARVAPAVHVFAKHTPNRVTVATGCHRHAFTSTS